MATKSKRGTPQPQGQAMSAPRPSKTSLSPTRQSRLQEKTDLQNLNDRLACYIERVRNLEDENSRLSREVQTNEETITKQVTNIRNMYDGELTAARHLLDQTAHEKSRMEIDMKRLWDDNQHANTKLDIAVKALKVAEDEAHKFQRKNTELTMKNNDISACLKKMQTDLTDAEIERDKMRQLSDDLRTNLENELLVRVDLENKNQTLREELTFKDEIYQQEITNTRVRRQEEITEIDGHLSERYEAKLQESLQELREQYDVQMAQNRDEIEGLYETKIRNLEAAIGRQSNATSSATEELRQYRNRMDGLQSRIRELEQQNSSVLLRCRDLEAILEAERSRHVDDLAAMEQEMQRLRDEMQTQLQEYQDLMDIKVTLDMEIAAYRKLLECEEQRLNITPSVATIVDGTPMKKRKRVVLDDSLENSHMEYYVNSTSKGDKMEIADVDTDGAFVKLHNKTDQEMALGGWCVVRKAGPTDSAVLTQYKFHRTLKVEANGTVTIWSANQYHEHEPPHNVVMKGQKWVTTDNMYTVLVNGNGEEVATFERIKRKVTSSILRHREGRGYNTEELHHQIGDPVANERCILM